MTVRTYHMACLDIHSSVFLVFIGILASLRKGELKEEDIHHLQSLSRPLHYDDGIEPSQLWVICSNKGIA